MAMKGLHIGQVAQAVTDAMNEHTFAIPFTAEKSYVPDIELESIESLKVLVTTNQFFSERVDRRQFQHGYSVNIGIVMPVDAAQTATVDPYLELAMEVAEYFEEISVLSVDGKLIILTEVSSEPPFYFDRLNDQNLFIAPIVVRFDLGVAH